jgi:hypothetical protein
MSYNSGINFGYDQVFVNPLESDYNEDYSPKMTHAKNTPNFSSGVNYQGNASQNGPTNIEEILKKRMADLENNMASYDNFTSGGRSNNYSINNEELKKMQELIEKENIRKSLEELKRKNDILTIFLIFLTIFVIIQYNSNSVRYSHTMAEMHQIPEKHLIPEKIITT